MRVTTPFTPMMCHKSSREAILHTYQTIPENDTVVRRDAVVVSALHPVGQLLAPAPDAESTTSTTRTTEAEMLTDGAGI